METPQHKILYNRDLLNYIRSFEDPCDIKAFNQLDYKVKKQRRREIIRDINDTMRNHPQIQEEKQRNPSFGEENFNGIMTIAIEAYSPLTADQLLDMLSFNDLCKLLHGLKRGENFF